MNRIHRMCTIYCRCTVVQYLLTGLVHDLAKRSKEDPPSCHKFKLKSPNSPGMTATYYVFTTYQLLLFHHWHVVLQPQMLSSDSAQIHLRRSHTRRCDNGLLLCSSGWSPRCLSNDQSPTPVLWCGTTSGHISHTCLWNCTYVHFSISFTFYIYFSGGMIGSCSDWVTCKRNKKDSLLSCLKMRQPSCFYIVPPVKSLTPVLDFHLSPQYATAIWCTAPLYTTKRPSEKSLNKNVQLNQKKFHDQHSHSVVSSAKLLVEL